MSTSYGLDLKGNPLMLNGQQLGRVVDRAVAVVVVADGAVEHVIAEDPVKRLLLRGHSPCRLGRDTHPLSDTGRTGTDQLAVDLDQARVARLDRPELWVVTDVGDQSAGAIDHLYEKLVTVWTS